MKHTFFLIDRILGLLASVPVKLKSEKDLREAGVILDSIREYEVKLGKLIDAHRTTEHLKNLNKCPDSEISDWAKKVDEQFRSLDALMKVLYEDIPKLKRVLAKGYTKQDWQGNHVNSNEWSSKIGDMSFGMIMTGFGHIEERMKEFRKMEIFERKHLEEILGESAALEILIDLGAIKELLE